MPAAITIDDTTFAEAMEAIADAEQGEQWTRGGCYRCDGPTTTAQVWRRGCYALVTICATCQTEQPEVKAPWTDQEIAAAFGEAA